MSLNCQIDSTLIRRCADGRLIKYDPVTDGFAFVEAADVGTITPLPQPRIRLSQTHGDGRQDKDDDLRHMCLDAMLDFQIRANEAGEPDAAEPYLEAIAQLASDKSAQRRLRMSWRTSQIHAESGMVNDVPPKRKYACVLAPLPKEVGEKLRQLGRLVDDKDLADKGREESSHVTIRHGLHSDDPEEILPLLNNGGPLKLRLGKVSVFPASGDHDFDVVKVEVESPELHALHERLGTLPHTDTHETYRPHATICYTRAGLGQFYADKMGSLDMDCECPVAVFSDAAKNKQSVRLSWVAAQTIRGTVKAVGEGFHAGRVLYGKKAQAALGNQGKRSDVQRSSERAHAILSDIHTKGISHADMKELATHLPALSVDRLRTARLLLDANWKGEGNRKASMVKRLQDHIREIVEGGGHVGTIDPNAPEREPVPKRTGPRPKTPVPEDHEPDFDADDEPRAHPDQTPIDADPDDPGAPPKTPKPGRVYNVATDQLKVDPARFQFKLNTNNPAGVTAELRNVKTFNPDFAGVISAWLDPEDGRTYVVNGHHRVELADRTGHPHLAVRYLQAKNAKEARALGALINLAEGRGTAVDAARFMRDSETSPEDLQKHGVSLSSKLATDATALTHLNDQAFDRVARGSLEPEKAIAVAKFLKNPQRQERLFSLLSKREDEGKDLSTRTIEELARQMNAAPTTTKTESTLWGTESTDEDTFVERGELAAYVRAELAKERHDYEAVASERRASRVAGAGNTLAVDENRKRADAAEQAQALYDTHSNLRGAIADALDAGSVKLKKAKNKKEREHVRSETLESVRQAINDKFASLAGKPKADRGGEGTSVEGSGKTDRDEPAVPGTDGSKTATDAGRRGDEQTGVKDLANRAKQVEEAARSSSIPWEKSGADRLRMVANQLESGWVSDVDGIAEAIKNYANQSRHLESPVGRTIDAVARELISRMTPEQKREMAEAYRAENRSDTEIAPSMKDLLQAHAPASHGKVLEGALARLGKLNLSPEDRTAFEKRIRESTGKTEEALTNAAYGILDEARRKQAAAPEPATKPKARPYVRDALGLPPLPPESPESPVPDKTQFLDRTKAAIADPKLWPDLERDLLHAQIRGDDLDQIIRALGSPRRVMGGKERKIEWLKAHKPTA